MSRKRPVTPHSLSERGHIWHVRGPWDGKQGLGSGFPIRPMGDGFFHFRGAKTGFFCEAATWGAFSIARDLRVVVEYRLRTTYHMPYVRASYLGIHAASCGVPPNPLESDRI